MFWFWALAIYVGIGLANYYQYLGSMAQHNARPAGKGEAVFFTFLWPLQVMYLLVVGVHMATESILERIFR